MVWYEKIAGEENGGVERRLQHGWSLPGNLSDLHLYKLESNVISSLPFSMYQQLH